MDNSIVHKDHYIFVPVLRISPNAVQRLVYKVLEYDTVDATLQYLMSYDPVLGDSCYQRYRELLLLLCTLPLGDVIALPSIGIQ